MLIRAEAFGRFVSDTLRYRGLQVQLCVFRDPWGGLPALHSGLNFKTFFEINALPSWELGYTYPDFHNNYPLRQKLIDMENICIDRSDHSLTVSQLTSDAVIKRGADSAKI